MYGQVVLSDNLTVRTYDDYSAEPGAVYYYWVVSLPNQTSITDDTGYRRNADDDFNDNAIDPTKWGTDMASNALLQEVRGHLEFTNYGAARVIKPWIYSYGSYTQNWEIATDVHVGNIALTQEGSDIEIFLGVAPQGQDFATACFAATLDLYRESGNSYREYGLYAIPGGSEPWITTTNQQATFCITFDASTKVLTAYYNGSMLGSMDIHQAGSSWGMTTNSTFQIGLGGYAYGINYSGQKVYSDNFSVTGVVTDGDGNGLPDWWERQYFGGTGINPATICSNGINTVREAYITGLNPNDRQSVFRASVMSNGKMIGWTTVSGRVYRVFWTTNLLSGFQCLESNIPRTIGSFTNQTNVPCGYYKIDVQLAE
jgi:hypothetical protein